MYIYIYDMYMYIYIYIYVICIYIYIYICVQTIIAMERSLRRGRRLSRADPAGIKLTDKIN